MEFLTQRHRLGLRAMMMVRASCLPQRPKAGDDAENLQGPEEAVPTRKRDFSRPGGKQCVNLFTWRGCKPLKQDATVMYKGSVCTLRPPSSSDGQSTKLLCWPRYQSEPTEKMAAPWKCKKIHLTLYFIGGRLET